MLRALSTLITSSSTLSNSAAPTEELLAGFGIDQQDAAQNIQFLKSLATEMLAVLFNVFSSVPREQRGMVGDVIALWLSIMGEKVSYSLCLAYNSLRLNPSNTNRRSLRPTSKSRPT
jgi:ribosomal RNA-processing protein 12